MYRLAVFTVVTSIVMGAVGVVYLINAINRTEDRRRNMAMTTAFFFGCLLTALLAAYMFSSKKHGGVRMPSMRMPSIRASPVNRAVRMDSAVMLAASAGAGSTMT